MLCDSAQLKLASAISYFLSFALQFIKKMTVVFDLVHRL